MRETKKLDLNKIYEKIKNEEKVDPKEKLVRYINFPKLISLIETKALFLSRADTFEDVNEGLFPDSFIKIGKKTNVGEKTLPAINYQTMQQDIESAKQNTFINSWNLLKSESYALWKIYGEKYGVAIQTTFQKLEELSRKKNAVVSKVVYLDDNSTYLHTDQNDISNPIINIFKLKKDYYSYEEEVRIILFDDSTKPSNTIQIGNVEEFISKIYVSPFAEEWFFELVTTVIQKRYRLNIEVVQSGIKVNK